jgi:type IX secretion system PorP/SprF family membrane protein
MNLNSIQQRLLTLLAVMCISLASIAQDIHFSQYYASPLTLNPALVGKFNGEWRVGAIYRSQWAPASKPLFMTPEVFADFSLFKGKLKGDALGVGISLYTDRQNKASFVWYYPSLSVAYHKGLGKNKGTQISLGFQEAYCMKNLNFNNMQFADGFTLGSDGYTYGSSSEVNNLKTSVNYFDMSAGLFANSKVHKKVTLYGGFTWFHLGHPLEQFSKSTTAQGTDIAWRFVVHGGAEVAVTNNVVLIPGLLYQYQGKAQEINFGLTAGYHIQVKPEGNTTVFAGVWDRLNPEYNGTSTSKWGEESIIPKIGFEAKRIRFGAALDIPLSSVGTFKNGQLAGTGLAASYKGNRPLAFEISLSYVGRTSHPKEDIYLFNPRF